MDNSAYNYTHNSWENDGPSYSSENDSFLRSLGINSSQELALPQALSEERDPGGNLWSYNHAEINVRSAVFVTIRVY